MTHSLSHTTASNQILVSEKYKSQIPIITTFSIKPQKTFHDLTQKQKQIYLLSLVNCKSIDYLIDKGYLPNITNDI